MKVHLAYGVGGLDVDVPDSSNVVVPVEPAALPDERGALLAAFETPVSGPPLSSLVAPGQHVVVVFPDITRPMPNKTVLPPLLERLEQLGAATSDILLLCSTGTHREATPAEMEALIGADLLRRYRVKQHVATAAADHTRVGTVDGVDIMLDRAYVEADLRIVTGFVEPHFFAGYSGGLKAVCPGVAALETVLEAHSPRRIGDPRATFTITVGNPVHDFVRAAAALLPPSFAVDVALDSQRRLTAVFAGALPASHGAACAYVEETAVRRVPRLYDVVVSTNSGFPLDRNLYQSVKGMAAAERIVRPGGTIVMAAECRDGIPKEGRFGEMLQRATTIEELASTAGSSVLDRWSSQVLGRILEKCRVQLRSDGLDEITIRRAFMEPIRDVSAALRSLVGDSGDRASVAVLPFGPLTVATAPEPLVDE